MARHTAFRHPLPHPVGLQDPSRRMWLQCAGAASAGLLVPATWAQSELSGVPAAGHRQASGLVDDAEPWGPIREALLAGLNLVPVVGGFLSYLGALFVPGAGQTPEERWRAYTDGSISEALFALVRADLIGLSNVAELYGNAVKSGDPNAIRAQSIAANSLFVAMLPRFMLDREREALLPLYATGASLHLALLRDMVLKADVLGFNAAFREQLLSQQKKAIAQYTEYVDREAEAAYARVRSANPRTGNAPLSQLLERRTTLQLGVLDQRDTWHAFDAEKHPERSPVILDRELYSRVIGVWDGSELDRNAIPGWKAPTSPLRSVEITLRRVQNIEVGFLDGVRMEYADGEELVAGQLAERSSPFRLAEGEAVVQVSTHWRSIQGLVSMELQTSRNRQYKVVGRENNFDVIDTSSQASHQLSSIRPIGRGRASAKWAAGACILGFQLVNRTFRPISASLRARVVPVIAPQLLDWIDERT